MILSAQYYSNRYSFHQLQDWILISHGMVFGWFSRILYDFMPMALDLFDSTLTINGKKHKPQFVCSLFLNNKPPGKAPVAITSEQRNQLHDHG